MKNAIDLSDEDVTIIPCTADGTFCMVQWTRKRIIVQNGLTKHDFPFDKCFIKSVWTERSTEDRNRTVRRAVLAIRTCAEWTYTLAPQAPAETETTLIRLALQLNKSEDAIGYRRLPRLPAGLPLDLRKIVTSDEASMSPGTPAWVSDVLNDDFVRAHWKAKTPWLQKLRALLIGNPMNTLLSCCASPIKAIVEEQTLRRNLFGDWIDWAREPTCLRTILVCRHGQEYLTDQMPDSLTTMGEAQMALTAHTLSILTDSFRHLYGIVSSTSLSCTQSGDILAELVKKFGRLPAARAKRVIHSALDERFIPHAYEVFETELVPLEAQMRIKEQVDKDGQEMEDTKSLFSSLLRGQGPLTATFRETVNPADLTSDARICGARDNATLIKYRIPIIESGPLKFAGVYLGHAAATRTIEMEGCHHTIYCGHSNSMRFHVLQELGFDWNFWMHCMTPHGTILPVGLSPLGQPRLIIADSACSMPNSPLAWTFSSLNYGQKKYDEIRNKFLQDKVVSLLPRLECYEEEVAPGIRYNAPSINDHSLSKKIVLLRKGHNVTRDASDTGLSELGHLQISNVAKWLAALLSSYRLGRPPCRWFVNGVTNYLTSQSDPSLNESILAFQKAFRDAYRLGNEDQSSGDSKDLYAENVFTYNSQSDLIHFILADDYHLLKYFASCFGVEPSILRHLFWPHAGFMIICITPQGWPYLPFFGTISHLPPALITYQAVTSEEGEASQTLDESVFERNIDSALRMSHGLGTMEFTGDAETESSQDSVSNIAPLAPNQSGDNYIPDTTSNTHHRIAQSWNESASEPITLLPRGSEERVSILQKTRSMSEASLTTDRGGTTPKHDINEKPWGLNQTQRTRSNSSAPLSSASSPSASHPYSKQLSTSS